MKLTTWYSPSFCPTKARTAQAAANIFGKRIAKRVSGRYGFCYLTKTSESYHGGLFCEAKIVIAFDSEHYVNRAEADKLNFCRIETGEMLDRNHLVIFEVDIQLVNELYFI